MKTLKRLIIGITFGAMLATTLLGTGSDAYAKTRTPGGSTQTNDAGPTSVPSTGGLFQALGATWE